MVTKPTELINCKEDSYNQWYLDDAWNWSNNLETVIYEGRIGQSVIGYITSSMNKLHVALRSNPRNYPAMLLGRLAANKNYSNKGVGTALVKYIIGLANRLKTTIGCRLIMLHVEHIYDQVEEKPIPNYKLIAWYVALGFENPEIYERNKAILFFDLL